MPNVYIAALLCVHVGVWGGSMYVNEKGDEVYVMTEPRPGAYLCDWHPYPCHHTYNVCMYVCMCSLIAVCIDDYKALPLFPVIAISLLIVVVN